MNAGSCLNSGGLHYSIRNNRRVSNKRQGPKWACLTHGMHAEVNCKICVERFAVCRAINLSRKCCLMFVEQLSFGASDGEKQPYHFEISALGMQKKAIAAVVRGLLEEELKDHVGAGQLANVVGPPYL